VRFKNLTMEKIPGLNQKIIKEILTQGKIYEVGGAVRDKYISPILPDKDKDYLVTGIPLEELCSLLCRFGKVDLVGDKILPIGEIQWRADLRHRHPEERDEHRRGT
jgi:hypothetical protein